jgi:hypothetical protein
MHKEQPDYLSYLLRLWRGSDEEEAVWRASLESPVTGERRGFSSLTELFAFLEKETGPGARGETATNTKVKGGDAHK